MSIPLYESGNVIITWNGEDLSTGWVEDTYLDIQPLGERLTHSFGADGQMATSKMANHGATITMTFQQTAPVNAILAKISAEQDRIGGAVPTSPFEVNDRTGNSAHFVALNARLSEVTGHTFGNTAGEKTWVWTCESYIQSDDLAVLTSAISEFLNF